MNSEAELEAHSLREEPSSESVRKRAAETAENSRKGVGLPKQVFHRMVEDDPVQPAIEYVYAALYEAETRAIVVGDWQGRTYPEDGV